MILEITEAGEAVIIEQADRIDGGNRRIVIAAMMIQHGIDEACTDLDNLPSRHEEFNDASTVRRAIRFHVGQEVHPLRIDRTSVAHDDAEVAHLPV